MKDDGTHIGQWKRPKAERAYLDLYAELRDEAWKALCEQGWSAPPDERDVETAFGKTHVFHWPGAGVPIVLLHGAGTSSVMWAPLIAELVGASVYAVDGIGEPGLSVHTAAVRGPDELVAWLGEVLDRLDLERVHLVGSSYGAWIAFNAAGAMPHRVASLSMLEPVLTKLRPYFWIHGLSVGLAFALPARFRQPALRRLHMNVAAESDRRVARFGRLGLLGYRRRLPKPVPVTDEQFAAVSTPTLLLLGEQSELHHAKALLARARAAMPDVEADLIANAGHSLPLDRAEAIGPRLRAFLAAHSATPT
jgi:pimeloyl-ACP methyl ester carboxylesterase